MIEVKVSQETLDKAKLKSKAMGGLNNSITKGDGNLSGFIGEDVVRLLYNYKEENTYDYDLVSLEGLKIDVKTKRTKVKPKSYYECSIAAFNTKQKCDRYFFVRVSNDLSTAWVLGYKDKEKYFSEAKFLKKGDVDPDNNFVVKADCYNLPISSLEVLDYEQT